MSLIQHLLIAVLGSKIVNSCGWNDETSDCSDPNNECGLTNCVKFSTPGGFYCDCSNSAPMSGPTNEPTYEPTPSPVTCGSMTSDCPSGTPSCSGFLKCGAIATTGACGCRSETYSCTLDTYIYVNDGVERTYDEAQEICNLTYNSFLAPIVTDGDWECTLDIIDDGPSPWFGLKMQGDENNYRFSYVDGTPCPSDSRTCLSSKYWENGKPLKCTNESKFHCGRILPDIEKISNDIVCEETLTAFLCKGSNFKVADTEMFPFEDYINIRNIIDYGSNASIMTLMVFTAILLCLLISYTFCCYWCLCKEKRQYAHAYDNVEVMK